MKVVVSNDSEAQALLLQMKVSEEEIKRRYSAQSDQEMVVTDVYRRVHYDLVAWLQGQGFSLR